MIDELRIFDEFEKSFGRRLLENFEEVDEFVNFVVSIRKGFLDFSRRIFSSTMKIYLCTL